ncbi:MAG: TlpA family protein disulfide reductase [Actinomycetota bacterium]
MRTYRIRTLSLLLSATLALAIFALPSATPAAATATPSRTVPFNFDAPTRPTLVFVFAYYCGYCKQVAPHFQSVVSAMSDRMDFVVVTSQTAPSQTREFIQRHGITATLVEDPNFDYAKYKVTGYPNFLWLEPGKEFRNLGPIGYDATTFTRRIQREWDAYFAAAVGKVENLTVTPSAEPGVFSASWTAAVSKLPITHYEVKVVNYTCDSVTTFGVVGVSSVIRIPNYKIGCRYWVEVRAAVAGGFGAYSSGKWFEWPDSNQVRCQRGKRVRTFPATACPTGWTKISA